MPAFDYSEPAKPRVEILGVEIDNVGFTEALRQIVELVDSKPFSYTVTPNVDHVMKLRQDQAFLDVYRSADLVVADGVPLLWAARLLGTPLQGRVNGTDLFEGLCEIAADQGHSIYLLGGGPTSAETAAYVLKTRFPSLQVAGHLCPPLGFDADQEQNSEVIAAVRKARPALLFVALGAPKQEKWIARHAAATGAKHAIGIGGSFAFVSGELRRAPSWMQRVGLEWLWRLILEPRRLTRRYLIDDSPFVAAVLAEAWRRRIRRRSQHSR